MFPPEKPTTSWGKTGPQIRMWSWSRIILFRLTGTSWSIRPSVNSIISFLGITPNVAKAWGSSQAWLKNPIREYGLAFSSGVIFTISRMSFSSSGRVGAQGDQKVQDFDAGHEGLCNGAEK